MVDQELVMRKLHELDRYLIQLNKHRGLQAEDLQQDLGLAWQVEHGLQLCIQIVLDIGNHFLAETGVTVGEYADIFEELVRLKVLPKEFARNISRMAGLRNILVHEYARVDYSRIANLINDNLDDFRRFARYIIGHLE